MATITAAAGGGNWSATGSWAGGVAPTSADDVLLTGTSGQITVDGGAGACRSLNCTGYTGTLTIPAATTLTIGDATSGLANVGLLLVSGMTLTLGNAATSAITFNSTSATVQAITTGGKTLGNVTLGNTGSWQLQDGLTNGATATLSVTKGTFDTNGQTCSWGLFESSNGNTRTLTMGASAITVTGSGTSWFASSGTASFTITANTATITLSDSGAGWTSGASNYNGATVVFSNLAGGTFTSSGTFANVTFTGTAVKTGSASSGGNFTCTGTFTLGGSTTQGVNRLLLQSSVVGTQRTITCAAVVISGDVDFQDIAFAGSPTWTNAGSAYVGDCGGNGALIGSHITVSATQTWSGVSGGNYSANAWTSRVPLPQDDVVISAAFSASQTVTVDMPRMGRSINFTGATGSPTLAFGTTAPSIFGSFTLAAGMSWTASSSYVFAGRGNYTINFAGVTSQKAFNITAPGGTYKAASDLTSSSQIIVNNGAFDGNGFNMNISELVATNNATRSVTLGAGTWTVTSTSTVWNINNTGTLTFSGATATIIISDTSSSTKTFTGGGMAYGTLRHTSTGSGGLTITGNNTFDLLDLECTTARTVTLPASGTQTVTGLLTLQGASGQLLSVVSSSPGTATTIRYNTISNTFTSVSGDVALTATAFGTGHLTLLGAG